MKRGEIYYIKSNYAETGNEIRGDRPAVIVSNDKCNEFSPVVEVVFLTTAPKKPLPTHVQIFSASRPSIVQCEQICSVAKERVENLQGKLSEEEMKAVNVALAISIGIDDLHRYDERGLPLAPFEIEEETTVEIEAEDDGEDGATYDELWDECRKLETELEVYKKLYTDLLNRLAR